MKNKILIIDDDKDILDALGEMLELSGYEVETCEKDGGYIDKRIEIFKPQLILLDVLLSGHDGRHICRRLKSQDKTKDIPIIMISAHPDAEKSALEAGANAFLPKPFDIGKLRDQIKLQLQ
jgi:DNA-binding response OmpR family regulator